MLKQTLWFIKYVFTLIYISELCNTLKENDFYLTPISKNHLLYVAWSLINSISHTY